MLLLVAVIAVVGVAGWHVWKKGHESPEHNPMSANGAVTGSAAVQAGKKLSSNSCEGEGDATFTYLPMKADDFAVLIPYGLMVGGHVTPIDHQYFQPTNFQSARDTYPIYAMADAKLVDIQPRTTPGHGTDYRLIFAHSCTFLYYYDLVTSLTGRTKDAYDAHKFNIDVKAGEQIGAIGGQTLDFAVWNTTKKLTGFVNSSSYDGEAWKVYTTDPFPYYTPSLRKIVEAKDPRVVEPLAGKIDHDVDGRLIGNWFIKGSGGYSGVSHGIDSNYSKTHLAFAPDLYDPSHFIVSVGSLYDKLPASQQSRMQHMTAANAPNPADVSVATGLVKYDLVDWRYYNPDGTMWDSFKPAKGLTARTTSGSNFGCATAQLTAARELKFEVFVGKDCSSVGGFDNDAVTYTR